MSHNPTGNDPGPQAKFGLLASPLPGQAAQDRSENAGAVGAEALQDAEEAGRDLLAQDRTGKHGEEGKKGQDA